MKFCAWLTDRRVNGLKNFNAAYIVSTNGLAMDKVDYIIQHILNPLWKDRKRLRPTVNDTLESYHVLFTSYNGLGSFLAAQVIADLKYIDACPLRNASDWYWFAASGPGSRRGLNRVMGRDPNAPWKEEKWRSELSWLRDQIIPKLPMDLQLHAQDLQNCLCEFDKYERARLGEGTPKQLYKEKN